MNSQELKSKLMTSILCSNGILITMLWELLSTTTMLKLLFMNHLLLPILTKEKTPSTSAPKWTLQELKMEICLFMKTQVNKPHTNSTSTTFPDSKDLKNHTMDITWSKPMTGICQPSELNKATMISLALSPQFRSSIKVKLKKPLNSLMI